MNIIVINIVRFVLLILAQLFVINNMDLGAGNYLISPIIYISFILTFPVKFNRYAFMFISFMLGLVIDLFSDTYGVHASACVLIAYLRPSFTKQLEEQASSFTEVYNLSIYSVDRLGYIRYASVLTALFLFWLFLLEEFSFRYLHIIILKTVISTIVSVLFMIIGQFLFLSKPKN